MPNVGVGITVPVGHQPQKTDRKRQALSVAITEARKMPEAGKTNHRAPKHFSQPRTREWSTIPLGQNSEISMFKNNQEQPTTCSSN